ncbi:MAG: phosphoribosylglycinamide formyltransferase [Actinomycetota bacterium]|nr:phosphoribosylglycinamide formyltransferase [Actinomycetota bacterium]
MPHLRLGVLASHGGSNLQAIIDACKQGALDAEVAVVISNNASSKALSRAARESIPRYHLSGATHPDFEQLDEEITRTLEKHQVDLVVLAGYMKKVGPRTLRRYPRRILNIHPALLPKFGGVGMYGRGVHEAVLAAGEDVTGVTIHMVDAEYDHGPVIAQTEVPVVEGDTPDSLAERVLEREHTFYVETLERIASGSLDLDLPSQNQPADRS